MANIFWGGKVHTFNFNPTKDGLIALGNEIESVSKIPAEYQMILYQGVALPILKAPFNVMNYYLTFSYLL